MSLMHQVRLAGQRFGVDITRYPASHPSHRIVKLMRHHRVDFVLDVGANDGDFARTVRTHGYEGKIVSFEPLAEPFTRLRQAAASDPLWDTMNWALGSEQGELVLNVAGNAGASSSFLPMLSRHSDAAPHASYVGTQTVAVHRLDDITTELGAGPGSRIYLKIDVQGYEATVLDGAKDLLNDPRVVGVQMELSFAELYEGGMTWREGVDRAESHGFRVAAMIPGFSEVDSGEMLQADGIFYRA